MKITDARHDPMWWHARRQMKKIAAQHEIEMARALVVTPEELAHGSERIEAAKAEGRIVLVRNASASDQR